MATVYKVEVERVSDWINYTEEKIAEIRHYKRRFL